MGVFCKGTHVYQVDHANYAWFENDFIRSSAAYISTLMIMDNGHFLASRILLKRDHTKMVENAG